MIIHTWNEKIVYCDDGYGYRIAESDEQEAVIIYYEERLDGKKETEQMKVCGSKMLRALATAMIEKADEWDATSNIPSDKPHSSS